MLQLVLDSINAIMRIDRDISSSERNGGERKERDEKGKEDRKRPCSCEWSHAERLIDEKLEGMEERRTDEHPRKYRDTRSN